MAPFSAGPCARKKQKPPSAAFLFGEIMGLLTARKRSALPAAEFGLPGSRKYPMPDKAHAANAKARATQQVKAGNLSPSAAGKIKAKANRVLGG